MVLRSKLNQIIRGNPCTCDLVIAQLLRHYDSSLDEMGFNGSLNGRKTEALLLPWDSMISTALLRTVFAELC